MRPSVGTEPGSRVLREPHLQAVALLLLDLAKVLAGAQGVSGRFGWCFGCAKHSDVFLCFGQVWMLSKACHGGLRGV